MRIVRCIPTETQSALSCLLRIVCFYVLHCFKMNSSFTENIAILRPEWRDPAIHLLFVNGRIRGSWRRRRFLIIPNIRNGDIQTAGMGFPASRAVQERWVHLSSRERMLWCRRDSNGKTQNLSKKDLRCILGNNLQMNKWISKDHSADVKGGNATGINSIMKTKLGLAGLARIVSFELHASEQ